MYELIFFQVIQSVFGTSLFFSLIIIDKIATLHFLSNFYEAARNNIPKTPFLEMVRGRPPLHLLAFGVLLHTGVPHRGSTELCQEVLDTHRLVDF